ncbi:MAG: hypothetical protein NC253_15910 [Ruminococcus sp.]|nr:hypothetical protein [Ruminococcus sp.]MCM1382109.1 hypothetical protein [Muribaculaceae bacterium]MCM1478532.1 hypothetical protein [Muribaculaceae bacterium]
MGTTNADIIEALKEVEEMERCPEKYKGYTDIDEMMRELLTEEVIDDVRNGRNLSRDFATVSELMADLNSDD